MPTATWRRWREWRSRPDRAADGRPRVSRCDPPPIARRGCGARSHLTGTEALVTPLESATNRQSRPRRAAPAPRAIRPGPESTYNRTAIPRLLRAWQHNKRERHRVVLYHVGSLYVLQGAEETTHPESSRAGGSLNSPIGPRISSVSVRVAHGRFASRHAPGGWCKLDSFNPQYRAVSLGG